MSKGNIIGTIAEIGIIGTLIAAIVHEEKEVDRISKERDEMINAAKEALDIVEQYSRMLDDANSTIDGLIGLEEVDYDE